MSLGLDEEVLTIDGQVVAIEAKLRTTQKRAMAQLRALNPVLVDTESFKARPSKND